jgi:hypothetical protein
MQMSARRALLAVLAAGSFVCSPHAPAAAPVVAATSVPLVKGLTLIGAASERQGDYESSTTVDSIEKDGSLHLTTQADVPDSAGGRPQSVVVTRSVRAADRNEGRTYKYLYYTGGEEEYPGTTSMGTSAAAVKAALVERGVSAARLNTARYGASVPRETNTTLAGRARNRRVELTRQ